MDRIKNIINDIYDIEIEDPKCQILIRSCIKAWLREAINQGIVLGREQLALELKTTIEKNLHPDVTVFVIERKARLSNENII